MRIQPDEFDSENPNSYAVDHEDSPGQVQISIPGSGEEIGELNTSKYEIENADVTDKEIVIEFNGEKHEFNRLSESIAETKDGIEYQYISETVK